MQIEYWVLYFDIETSGQVMTDQLSLIIAIERR